MDEEFLLSLKKGDKDAFYKLYKIYSNKIYRFGYSLKNNEEFAENLVQETFIKVFKNINSFNLNKDLKNSLQSWIYKIAKNHALNEIKKFNKMREVIGGEQNYEKIGFLNKIEDKIIRNEKVKLIFNELNKLSIKKRMTVILFFIEELTADEIAVIMKENRGTTLKRLQRVKKELQEILIVGGV